MLKCRVLCGNPLQRFGSGLEPDPEPNRESGPVANTRSSTSGSLRHCILDTLPCNQPLLTEGVLVVVLP